MRPGMSSHGLGQEQFPYLRKWEVCSVIEGILKHILCWSPVRRPKGKGGTYYTVTVVMYFEIGFAPCFLSDFGKSSVAPSGLSAR